MARSAANATGGRLQHRQDSFEDLGRELSEVTFCVVDLETTGGSEQDAITEFGAVRVCGGEHLGEFQTLVNPRSHIPPLIAVLTGITNQMVAAAPPLASVLPAFLEFAQGCVLVAHNSPFDVGFLRRGCAELGYRWPGFAVVDTAALARQILLRDEVANCKLSTLSAHFHTQVAPNHRALTDAQATVEVLHGLLERVGNLGVRTIEDLQEFTRKVSAQRRAKRTWATDLPEEPASTSSSPMIVGPPAPISAQVTTAVPKPAQSMVPRPATRPAARCSTWARAATSVGGSAAISRRPKSGHASMRWFGSPPGSRPIRATPVYRPTWSSCG